MAVCKNCQKKFHACRSCYFNNMWEYRYCSDSCWESSDEYELVLEKWKSIGSYLESTELGYLREMLEDEDYITVGLSLLEEYDIQTR